MEVSLASESGRKDGRSLQKNAGWSAARHFGGSLELVSRYCSGTERQETRPARRGSRPDSSRRHHQDSQRQRRGAIAVSCAGNRLADHLTHRTPARVQEPSGARRRQTETPAPLYTVRNSARSASRGKDRPRVGVGSLPRLRHRRGSLPRVCRCKTLRSNGAGEPTRRIGKDAVARGWNGRAMGRRAVVELPGRHASLQIDHAAVTVRVGLGRSRYLQRLENQSALSGSDAGRLALVRDRLPVYRLRFDRRRLP